MSGSSVPFGLILLGALFTSQPVWGEARPRELPVGATCRGARSGLARTNQRGRPLRLRPLLNSSGLRVQRPELAWGTAIAVSRLQALATAYRARFPSAAPIRVHDMSRRQGGPLMRHYSHRDGRDADIRLPLKVETRYVDATAETLDVERTWFLLGSLIVTCDVEFIMLDRSLQAPLFQRALRRQVPREILGRILEYPYRFQRFHPDNAVVRHYPRHRNHFHVRFRAAGRRLQQRSAAYLCSPSPDLGGKLPIMRVVELEEGRIPLTAL